jgi:hypothetical protein
MTWLLRSVRRSEPVRLCHQLTDFLFGKDVRFVPPSMGGQEPVWWRLGARVYRAQPGGKLSNNAEPP